MDYDVVIAGAGPVGLLLACELRLAGVSVLVLEKLTDPYLATKAGGVGGRALNLPSVEAFYRRGLLPALRKAALWWIDLSEGAHTPVAGPFAGHFAGILLDASLIDYNDPEFAGRGPASGGGFISLESLERLLSERAARLDVELRRGTALTRIEVEQDGVTVVAGDTRVRTGWLVGCDGGRSTVRKLAGFDFPGTEPELTGYVALVDIADAHKLASGWNRTNRGLYVNGPVPGRISLVEFCVAPADRDAPITLETLQTSLRNVSGTDVTLTAVHVVTRWTDNARPSTTYRMGRVLLAGDAAHVHSPFGGQGLNLGIGDAMNLGWKLAATVNGFAPEGLLDTYTTERHPLGAWAVEWTRAQVALLRPKPHEQALYGIVKDLIATRQGTTYFAKKISGAWQRYGLPGRHPLIGRSAPDLEFEDGSRLGEYTREGRALLFNLADNAELAAFGARWGERLRVVTKRTRGASPLAALFVRPDGCVAWACNDQADVAEGYVAVSSWLGKPVRHDVES
jgi:2-polyprenyl-6-methoxyphenol hydroxylase-like FAD-dependent oxidoreductase